jgi:hypothetical protein
LNASATAASLSGTGRAKASARITPACGWRTPGQERAVMSAPAAEAIVALSRSMMTALPWCRMR